MAENTHDKLTKLTNTDLDKLDNDVRNMKDVAVATVEKLMERGGRTGSTRNRHEWKRIKERLHRSDENRKSHVEIKKVLESVEPVDNLMERADQLNENPRQFRQVSRHSRHKWCCPCCPCIPITCLFM